MDPAEEVIQALEGDIAEARLRLHRLEGELEGAKKVRRAYQAAQEPKRLETGGQTRRAPAPLQMRKRWKTVCNALLREGNAPRTSQEIREIAASIGESMSPDAVHNGVKRHLAAGNLIDAGDGCYQVSDVAIEKYELWANRGGTDEPVLDPMRDLRGATPEKLARALFRRTEPFAPRTRRQPIRGRQVRVDEVAPNKPGNRVPHLDEGA